MICEGTKFIEKNQPGIEVILKKIFRPQLWYVKVSNLLRKKILPKLGYWGDIENKIWPQLGYVKGSNLWNKISQVLRWYWNFFLAPARLCEGINFIEKNQPGIEVILKKMFRPQLWYVKGSNLLKKISLVLIKNIQQTITHSHLI